MARFRLMFSLMLAASLMMIAAGGAQAQSSTPEVPTIGVREILESGQSVSDEFTADSTAYLYGFSGSKGDRVTISMVQNTDSDLDPFLVLLGPKGEMLASDDDSGTDVFGSSLISSKELPDDGSYLVMATTFAHIDEILVETGNATAEPTDESFTLTVTGNHPAADLSADQSLISIRNIAKGDTLDGESTLDEPVGYYVYTGKAGDTLTITTSSDDFDTILHVFDPEGNRIAVNDDDIQGTDVSTNAAVRDLTLPEDGTYMIFATDVFFYNAGVKVGDDALAYTGGSFTIHAE